MLDACRRAANHLPVGQIYLVDRSLLREPSQAEHVRPPLPGHRGTPPGLKDRMTASIAPRRRPPTVAFSRPFGRGPRASPGDVTSPSHRW
jgi:xylulose-5-phosphate/fructose-6-phosphate phosphoketolase